MLLTRYIPCLLLKGAGLVKTIKFKNPKYVGDPINTVRIFNEKEVDELIFLDIEATPQDREPNYKLLSEIADECFMPLAYGGGIKTLEQAIKIFQIGIEKVAINSAAHNNLKLIGEIAAIYGTQAVIGIIDVKKSLFGKQEVVSNSANTKHKFTPEAWAQELVKAGVGEIMVTSVDKEGTWEGIDVTLIKRITDSVSIPVIAHGGAGNADHLKDAVRNGGASAVAMGSMVVYQKKDFGVLINFPDKKILEKI
jgi:cyclase